MDNQQAVDPDPESDTETIEIYGHCILCGRWVDSQDTHCDVILDPEGGIFMVYCGTCVTEVLK